MAHGIGFRLKRKIGGKSGYKLARFVKSIEHNPFNKLLEYTWSDKKGK